MYSLWSFVPKVIKNMFLRIILKIKFKKVVFEENISFQLNDLYENKIHIGENTFIWKDWNFYAWENQIQIWKYCSIASEVYMITHSHSTEYISHHINQYKKVINLNHERKKEDIIIHNDVWIWNRVTILPWIHIGNWAIIWAGSIVTKDVPPYSIVWWNPAKVISYRFNEETIQLIENSNWRNWCNDKIKNNIDFFNVKASKIDYKRIN